MAERTNPQKTEGVKHRKFRLLGYITHVDNLQSILEKGILSHEEVQKENIQYKAVYNQEIVNIRKEKKTPEGKSLWQYVNLYRWPRNTMLYTVLKNSERNSICVITCYPVSVKKLPGVLITDGNAANNQTKMYPIEAEEGVLRELEDVENLEYWNTADGTKRRLQAEVLVPNRIPAEHIQSIYVPNEEVERKVKQNISNKSVEVIKEPYIFFQPEFNFNLTDKITLAIGDMYFSNMQTLTVSVNTQGVMGKGLASRAKYQFPDVYVRYQKVCKDKTLTTRTPVLYKRETSMDIELMDDENQRTDPYFLPNNRKWFLLFATKELWRNNSKLDYITNGMKWLEDNFEKEEIESLALPALGCGLGGLSWAQVGPIMCKSLERMGIRAEVYLPNERKPDQKYLSREFLLGKEL